MEKNKIIEAIECKITMPKNITDAVKFRNTYTKNTLDALDKTVGREGYPNNSDLADIIALMLERAMVIQKAKNHPNWKTSSRLETPQICEVLRHLHIFAKVSMDDNGNDAGTVLMYYDNDSGIYTNDMSVIYKEISELSQGRAGDKDCKAILFNLKAQAPYKARCKDASLIPVGNGIFDTKTKSLLNYSPDIVFTTKSPIDYKEDAQNVTIENPDGTKWDVETWLNTLSNDEEVQQLLREIIAAALRPGLHIDKAVWFYSESGNNGKGSLCQLIRNLVGPSNCVSIPVRSFDTRFGCAPLIGKSVVVCDENPVGQYIDTSSNYKSCITGDEIIVDIKNAAAVSISFHGIIIQCHNGMPKTRDKSSSFYRRLLLIPFCNSFQGSERKYIKHDYLHRTEVLEYVLKKALEMNLKELSCPVVCQTALQEYIEYNNTVSEYWSEFRERFVWNLVPNDFLYQLYVEWCRLNSPSGKVVAKKDFLLELKKVVEEDDIWSWKGDQKDKVKTGNKMNSVEGLIVEFNLVRWMDPLYTGNVPEKITNFKRKETYRGIVRK